MTAVVDVADLRGALRAEREAIERNQHAELLRIQEIRVELAMLPEDGLLDG